MRALLWNGVNDLRVETVPDPELANPHDVVLRVTMSTTCGSDLHLIDGYIPTMREGGVIGHEFMGVVEEVGPAVKKVRLLEHAARSELDPSYLATHRVPLEDAVRGYDMFKHMFKHKTDGCVRAVFTP